MEYKLNKIKFSPRNELILPEYGRNIQQMVEHAVAIEDRAERTRCANTIINIMGSMFPYLRDVEGFKFKLWDHLAIMSKFKLDIDYPFEIIKKEDVLQRPSKMAYSTKKFHYLHYGSIIEKFIDKTGEVENEEVKNALIMMIANYMKKSLLEWNNKNIDIDDKKIFNDLYELSKGKISLNTDDLKLISSDNLRQKNKNNNKNNSNNNNNRRRRRSKKSSND